eukprot:TRINITY_DN15455_c0_g2_i4.p1 TRINITY_DN15455_c0_g2~~TRINITY_DN15455_c0_g2_i4.p1  ORF type:complete len:713 (-),score=89.46 TRINITY_DN15455_c0_g2_i4:120-2258(-)
MEGVNRESEEGGTSVDFSSCPEALRKERIRYFPTSPWLRLQLPVSFVDPDLEREYERNLCDRQAVVLKRCFYVTLVATALNVGAQYDGDLGGDERGGDERFVRYTSYACLPLVMLLTANFGTALAARKATAFYEYMVCAGFGCVAVLFLLANRSRSVWIVGGDTVDVFSVFSHREKIVMQSDTFTAMNLATTVIASFVSVPIRCSRAWILLLVYPVVYIVLTLPLPLDQVELSLSRRAIVSLQILIQSLVGFLGRVALETSERDSILRMQLIQEMAVNERVLRYKAEHEAERGPMSQAKALEPHKEMAVNERVLLRYKAEHEAERGPMSQAKALEPHKEMAVNERVLLRYKAEHEAERGPMSQAKALEPHKDAADDAAGAEKEAAPEIVDQVQIDDSARSSRPWSCLLVDMSKIEHPDLPSALLVLGAEEGWLLEPRCIEDQTHADFLGHGHQGCVVLASFLGTPVALKTARPRADKRSDLAGLTNEIRALRKLRHPNIVSFFGVTVEEGAGTFALVLEYLKGPCLDSFVEEFHSYSHPYVRDSHSVLQGICSALRYLHGLVPCTIVHCDLKPQNIKVVLSKACVQAKLLDFGYSQHVQGPKTCGRTIQWCAPELLDGSVPTSAADVFSFGYISYFCFSRKTPWDAKSPWELSSETMQVAALQLASEDTRAEARTRFLEQLCKLSPEERPSMEEVATLLSALCSCESAMLKL